MNTLATLDHAETAERTDLAAADRITLMLNEDSTLDEFADAFNVVAVLKDRVRDIEAQLKNVALERCQKHGAFIIGTKKYFAGPTKTTKCLNVPQAVRALLEAAAGDEDLVLGCLASDAIKYGAAKKVLPAAVYDALFATETKTTLKNGEPTKTDLQVLDTRFLTH